MNTIENLFQNFSFCSIFLKFLICIYSSPFFIHFNLFKQEIKSNLTLSPLPKFWPNMVYNGTIFWCSKFSFNFHFPHPLGILINIFKHKFSTILNNSILFFQNVIGQVLHKGNMIFSFTFSCNSILIHTSLISFNTIWYNFYVNYINHLNPLFIWQMDKLWF